MQLLIVAIGHEAPSWIGKGFSKYTKRIPPELRIELCEIKSEQRSGNRTAATVMQLEAAYIGAALPRSRHMITLDERRKNLITVALAESLTGQQREGGGTAFVIGGTDGLNLALKIKACTLIRLSSLMLPHGTVRALLAEQLYRAWGVT